MKLEVGEYIRTDNGAINKILLFEEDDEVITENDELYYDYEILKSSKSIIDLIEVGDYVNKHLVINKSEDSVITEYNSYDGYIYYRANEIYSILTKEQYERMCYEVK